MLYRFSLLLLLSVLLPALIGCGEDAPRDAAPAIEEPNDTIATFTPPDFEEGRALDTIVGLNLDSDPEPEHIVASLSTSTPFPAQIRADRLDVYDLDARGEWQQVARDTALWYQSWQIVDLTGDDLPEFIATTWGGGNDEVAGRGMSILSGEGDSIRTIFQRSGGAPRIDAWEEKNLLLISSLFWPEFLPHAAAVPIVEEVLLFDGAEPRADYQTARDWFDRESEVMRRELDMVIAESSETSESGAPRKPAPEVQAKLFSLAVRALRGAQRSEAEDRLDYFRSEIMPRLAPLLEEEQVMMIEDEIYGP